MTPAAEPTFNTNEQEASTRVKDNLKLAFPTTAPTDPVAWEQIPLTTELQGFQPNRQVVRKEAFVEADGQEVSLVAIIGAGGNIQFNTASKAALRDKILAHSQAGSTVLFKANYVSAGVQVWGAAKINDRGVQGGRNDIPDWGFTLEASKAKYVNAAGEDIKVA